MLVPLVVTLLIAAKPPADPRLDLLDAMVEEINRNQVELKLRENRGPYFIGYQLKDYDSREVMARYGALFQDATHRDRKISVDVRVGEYGFDSSIGDELDLSFSLKGTSYLARKSAPLDDSPAALRTALWLLTDEKYKQALFNYLKKKGDDVYSVEDPKRPPSFSKESPEVQVGVRAPFVFSRDRWVAFSREVSSRLAGEKAFFDSEVRISGDKVVRYFVNTEGTRIVTEDTLYGVHVQVYTRADDGQLLENSREFYAPLESQLPGDALMKKEVEVMVTELLALRLAPTIDPYTGPAILDAEAAGVLFHEAVGHRLEGERQDNEAEGKTFRGQVGRQVLPPFISVIDDPTAVERAGEQLNGHYLFDEEGVKAQKVTLVKAGVLQTYLLSRRPVEGFLKSNGHGRAQGSRKPIARMANLLVESTKRFSAADLKAQLIAEAKRQGKPFGLLIRDITGGNTNTTSFGYQAFKGTPRMVYRVDLKTGAETLVRGVEIVGTPLSSINRILGTGQTDGVFNGFCGAESGMVPVSTVAPAVLLQEIELQRALEGKDRPPLIPSPVSLKK
ncbi:MAG: TldD/PmbA family protein [Archangium sp.]|nr:TldD/PmbA family protein [Archangium sp.]MDP3569935.1 TldD/PmbA family protein [Archangium sp.]